MSMRFLPGRQSPQPPPRPLVDPQSKLILFWMHRCGSTTGQRWFFELAGWKDRMAGKGAGELSSLWHAEHREAYQNLPQFYRDSSFLKVATSRHPLFRAVSSFTVVTDSKSGAQWKTVSKSIAAPDEERRLTFLEYLDFLEMENLANANYHWRFQTAQDWYDLAIPDIRFVRLESIRAGLNNISRLIGKRPLPLRINSAQSTCRTKTPAAEVVNFTRADFARQFGHDKRGVIRFPEYSKFLTPETVERLARLYARDF